MAWLISSSNTNANTYSMSWIIKFWSRTCWSSRNKKENSTKQKYHISVCTIVWWTFSLGVGGNWGYSEVDDQAMGDSLVRHGFQVSCGGDVCFYTRCLLVCWTNLWRTRSMGTLYAFQPQNPHPHGTCNFKSHVYNGTYHMHHDDVSSTSVHYFA